MIYDKCMFDPKFLILFPKVKQWPGLALSMFQRKQQPVVCTGAEVAVMR